MDTILVLVFLAVLGEKPAHAYADPGSGTLLWQILVSAFVGTLFYLRKLATHWKRKDHH